MYPCVYMCIYMYMYEYMIYECINLGMCIGTHALACMCMHI